MLRPAEGRLEDLAARREETGFRITAWQRLPVALLEFRFVIPCVHVGRRARHEEPDDGLRAGGKRRRAESQRVAWRRSAQCLLSLQDRGQRNRAKAKPRMLQELASRRQIHAAGNEWVEHGRGKLKREAG